MDWVPGEFTAPHLGIGKIHGFPVDSPTNPLENAPKKRRILLCYDLLFTNMFSLFNHYSSPWKSQFFITIKSQMMRPRFFGPGSSAEFAGIPQAPRNWVHPTRWCVGKHPFRAIRLVQEFATIHRKLPNCFFWLIKIFNLSSRSTLYNSSYR